MKVYVLSHLDLERVVVFVGLSKESVNLYIEDQVLLHKTDSFVSRAYVEWEDGNPTIVVEDTGGDYCVEYILEEHEAR